MSLDELARLEGVASAMAATRDGIDALLRDRGLRRTTPELTGESLLRGAAANASLAGSPLGLESLRRGETDEPAAAALRVSTELLSLLPVVATAPLQALARLHAVAAGPYAVDSGRPKDDRGAHALQEVSRLLSSPTTAPALVLAAVVHAEIATAGAFGSYDALVARGMERLVLVQRGVDPVSVTVPEAGHLAQGPAYLSHLDAYGAGDATAAHAWLLYAARAYASGAQQSPLSPR